MVEFDFLRKTCDIFPISFCFLINTCYLSTQNPVSDGFFSDLSKTVRFKRLLGVDKATLKNSLIFKENQENYKMMFSPQFFLA